MIDKGFPLLNEIYQEYFPSESMNRTVQLVREKLNKVNHQVSSIIVSFLNIIVIIAYLNFTFDSWNFYRYNQGPSKQKLVLPKRHVSITEEESK